MMTNRDIVAIAIFAAFFIACSVAPTIMLPYLPVPITAQTLAVILSGALLGPKRGTLAILLVFVLAALGLPVLAQGKGGIASFFSPASGYLYSFPIAAYFTGKIYQYGKPISWVKEYILLFIGAIIIIHSMGSLWLSFFLDIPLKKAFLGSLIFIPGDIIKLLIAIFIIKTIRKYYPTAFSSKRPGTY